MVESHCLKPTMSTRKIQRHPQGHHEPQGDIAAPATALMHDLDMLVNLESQNVLNQQVLVGAGATSLHIKAWTGAQAPIVQRCFSTLSF